MCIYLTIRVRPNYSANKAAAGDASVYICTLLLAPLGNFYFM